MKKERFKKKKKNQTTPFGSPPITENKINVHEPKPFNMHGLHCTINIPLDVNAV